MLVFFQILLTLYPIIFIVVIVIFGVMHIISSRGLSVGERTFMWAILTLGLSIIYNILRGVYVDKSWSDPWDKNKNNRHSGSYIVRHNPITNIYQGYSRGAWEDLKHCQGDPLDITFTDFKSGQQTFNPYDLFQKPLKPTKEEIALFHVDFSVDYETIRNDVNKILKGGK